jgi:hypothetical protein
LGFRVAAFFAAGAGRVFFFARGSCVVTGAGLACLAGELGGAGACAFRPNQQPFRSSAATIRNTPEYLMRW